MVLVSSFAIGQPAPSEVPPAVIRVLQPALDAQQLGLGGVLHHVQFSELSPEARQWQIEYGMATQADNGVIIRHTHHEHANHILTQAFTNALITFSFELRTASRIGFIVDDTDRRHAAYFSIQPRRINLPTKEKRGEASDYQEDAGLRLGPGRHTACVAFLGERMIGWVDDHPPLQCSRSRFAVPKSRLKLEVYDGEAIFHQFTLRALEAKTK